MADDRTAYPKGWTGPKVVDGLPSEGTFRAHQVPLPHVRENPEHLRQLEAWLRSYRPEELFMPDGALRPEIAALAPQGERRMSASPHANGGLLLRDLDRPDIRDYAVEVPSPGKTRAEATRVLGTYLRSVIEKNRDNFRIIGPDETVSNRLGAVLDVTDRVWMAERQPNDDHLAPEGRVMEVLSEHLCEGWMEGYLLTGRHGLFNCYEAFIHIVDCDVQPARQVAQGHQRHPLAHAHRLAELPADLARVAPGPQRLLAPGPRLHRPRRQQEGGGDPRLPAAGHQHAALRHGPLPAQPPERQRRRRRQAAER